MLPADQVQASLTAAQQDNRSTPGAVSSPGCAYQLGPVCVDGVLGVGALGAGAVLLIAAVALAARSPR